VSELGSLRARGSLIEALSSALDRGSHGLENVPGLLKRVLEEKSWREFETARGEQVAHSQFVSFVAEPPLRGLGANMDIIKRIIGTEDPDLLRLLREARKVGQGCRTDLDPTPGVDSALSSKGEASDLTAQRLATASPEEYAAVQRGEKTLHAAAIAAGIRRPRVSVRVDSAESAAETLRRYMTPGELTKLRHLLRK
jgi:hypothetical protein